MTRSSPLHTHADTHTHKLTEDVSLLQSDQTGYGVHPPTHPTAYSIGTVVTATVRSAEEKGEGTFYIEIFYCTE